MLLVSLPDQLGLGSELLRSPFLFIYFFVGWIMVATSLIPIVDKQ